MTQVRFASTAALTLAAALVAGACGKSDSTPASPDAAAGAGGKDAGSGGSGGTSGSGAGGATGGSSGVGAAGASGAAGSCPTAYDLPSYSGDTSGLCPPEDNTQCSCFEYLSAGVVMCSAAGECCYFVDFCEVCGWIDCGEGANGPYDYPNCKANEAAFYAAAAGPRCHPCAADSDCKDGTCSVRLGNRMFCSQPDGGT